MRWFVLLSLLVGLGLGCQTSRVGSTGAENPVWSEDDQASEVTGKGSENDRVIIPVTSSTGVVAAVNDPLRFVVLDYALTRLPEMDQILFIYRRGQKVARVKVTGPFRGQTVAADIVEGVAAKGDEVRAE